MAEQEMDQQPQTDVSADSSPADSRYLLDPESGRRIPFIAGGGFGGEGGGDAGGVATDPGTDPSTQVPGGDPAQTQTQTIPYSRFKEVNDGYRASAAENAVLRQQYQQLAAEVQRQQQERQRAGQPSQLPEDHMKAGDTLYELMSRHPRFARMIQLEQAGPLLAEGYQTAQTAQQQATHRYIADEHTRLGAMAEKAGLPSTPADIMNLSHQVAGLIYGNPRAAAAYRAGDRRVLDAALHSIVTMYAGAGRQQAVRLAQTKTRTTQLPPRSAGGPPGIPPQPAFGKMTEREFYKEGSKRLQARLDEQRQE